MQKIFVISTCKWLLTLCMACAGFAALAADHITARSYWQDDTAQATFEQAKEQHYTTYEGVLGRGFTQAAIWIRIDIAQPTKSAPTDKLVFRISPVFLDEITLYDPLDTTGLTRKVGDSVSFESNEYKSLTHTFVIPAGDQPRTVWMRVKTTSSSLVNVELFTQKEMLSSEFKLLTSDFSILAVVAMFMMVVLINWFNHRESLYAVFVVRQVFYFLYIASLFGFHRVLLSEVLEAKSLDVMYSVIVIGVTAVGLFFEYKFFNEYSPPKWAKAILQGLFVWSMLAAALLLAGYVHQALKINMLLNLVALLIFLVLAAAFIDDKHIQSSATTSLLSKRVVVGYYSLLNLVMATSLFPYLGLTKSNELAVNGLVIYALCSSTVMTVLMQLRARQIQKAQRAFEQELLISKQQVELEKSRREEQTHLFHMLMHELKNPLAIIDMALLAKNDLEKTSSYVNRAVNNMKAILERCVKADKLTEGNVTIRKVPVNVSKFLRELLSTEERHQVQVALDVRDTLTVDTDAQFLEIMCSNLVDNAVRYGDYMMPVLVQAQTKLNDQGVSGVSITVSNRPGAASWPDADKVFKKYYRSAGAETQSGTGLGLYLVRTLARLVGGDCVYLPDEKNIKFELWLPS